MKKVVNLSLKINSCLKSGQLSLKIDGYLFQYTKNKQPLSDFQAQIGADPKQPEAQLKYGVAYKKKTCTQERHVWLRLFPAAKKKLEIGQEDMSQ